MGKVIHFLLITLGYCFALMCNSVALGYSVNKGKCTFRFDLKQELRFEYWDTFDKKGYQDGYDYNRTYDFVSNKLRLGIGMSYSLIDTYVQLNWTQFGGLPDDAEFGLGALYYKFNGHFGGPVTHPSKSTDPGYVALSQLWIRVRSPFLNGFWFKFGRFLYLSGLEAGLPKNKNLRWLKKLRVSQRMIGPFDWSRVGRGFDGFEVSYDSRFWNITASYMHPTPGGFYLKRDDWTKNGKSTHRISIATVTFSIKENNPCLPDTDAQLFYYYYNDKRRLPFNIKIINGHNYTAELSGLGDCEIHMAGAHLIHVHKVGPEMLDFLIWGGYQWGNWGRGIGGNDHVLDHNAWAISLEAGCNFKNFPWNPWIRGGYFYGTGDGDPDDRKHHTFFMMIPTLRIYSLTPSYTFMNTNYFMTQVILTPCRKVLVRSDVHFVRLTEGADFWYLGSGMMRPDKGSYGYISSHISTKDKDLLRMWDLSVFLKNIYNLSGIKVDIDIYVSHIWGGEVVKKAFQAKHNLTFFYTEVRLSF